MNLPQEIVIKINGVDYKLSKFTLPLYTEFLDWAKAQLPDPFEGLAERIKGLSDHLAKHLIDKAEERASQTKTINHPDIQALTQSPEGLRKIFALLFRKHQPNLTEDDVMEIVEGGIAEYGEDLFRQIFPEGKRVVSK